MDFNHSTDIQIRFGDIDMMGHVNNGIQLSYLDVARMQYFMGIFGQTINPQDVSPIVAHLEIDFLAPIFLMDTISVETKISRIGNKSLNISQNIINKLTGKILTQTNQVMVCYSPKNKESINIPEILRIRIEEFEKVSLV